MTQTFWSTLAEHLDRGEEAFVALVVDHTKHSPGTRGAKVYFAPDGSQFGTIGGGVMEARVRDLGEQWFGGGRGPGTAVLHHRADADGERSGLICAGEQTMMYFLADPSHARIYRLFADAIEKDREVELRLTDGQPLVVDRAVGLQPPVELLGEVYAEHAVRRHRIAIAGGGHCGLALSRVMRQLGYHVTLFETRSDVYTFTQNTWADVRVVVDDFSAAARLVPFPELTHFVVMTADLRSDVRALLGSLGVTFPFIGVMGSAAKLDRITAELDAEGVTSGWLESLRAPIGLPMASDTPDEIAVSVAAQILGERHELFPWSRPSRTVHQPAS